MQLASTVDESAAHEQPWAGAFSIRRLILPTTGVIPTLALSGITERRESSIDVDVPRALQSTGECRMNMNALQLLAGLLIAAALVKMVVIFITPQIWFGWVRKMYSNPQRTSATAFVLAMIVLYFLVAAGVSIVEILAVGLFIALLMVIGLAHYAEPLLAWMMQQDIKAMLKAQWLYTLTWVALLIWGLWAIVFGN